MDKNIKHTESIQNIVRLKKDDTKCWHRNPIQIRDDGIYAPCCEFSEEGTESNYKLMLSKGDFISAYNKYINDNTSNDSKLPDKDSYFRSVMDTYSFKDGVGCHYSEPLFKCPKCGGNVRKNLTMNLCSYPPKYRYECSDCDYCTTGV